MGSDAEMLPFQPEAFRMLAGLAPIEDAVAALICHGALSRFPALKVAVIENGSSWVEPLLRTWPTSTRRCRRTSWRTRWP